MNLSLEILYRWAESISWLRFYWLFHLSELFCYKTFCRFVAHFIFGIFFVAVIVVAIFAGQLDMNQHRKFECNIIFRMVFRDNFLNFFFISRQLAVDVTGMRHSLTFITSSIFFNTNSHNLTNFKTNIWWLCAIFIDWYENLPTCQLQHEKKEKKKRKTFSKNPSNTFTSLKGWKFWQMTIQFACIFRKIPI